MTDVSHSPSAKDVKALRDRTGAGMMDCKKALTESGGDVDKAIEILRVKQGKRIEDRGERLATEGTVQSYVHSNAKVGVLVEVDTETDFVARNDELVAFAKDIALHIAAAAPEYVTEEDVDEERRQSELRVYEQEAADKPENVRAKIAEGKLRKWYETVVLLDQPHVNGDKYDGKTIGQLLDEVRAKTGENVQIRRFARFAVGQ
ncbi:Elongation factor Ts [Capillimicrobium parvum]|uniref:Elongation factor Ts n=2 Tax=Capillimicrobium parvum TaxID=2884022 RepID=A0A9E6XYX5_9ACTN|nr:Elongation factor Ts [Capillimicrobium parvum]